jgi:hypothetical protein
MNNIKIIFQYTIEILKQMDIRHEFYSFSSGAIMLDIWHNDKFYVMQFEDYIGVSEVNDTNISFDNIPDEKFYNEIEYKNKLKSIINV